MFEAVKGKYGFVPNLIREMAKSAAVARAYLAGQDAMAGASLSAPEQQLVQLAVAVYNECQYCRAARRMTSRMAGIAQSEIDLVEKGALPEGRRLRGLVLAAWHVLDTRGWLGGFDLASLEADCIDRGQLYEIVALVGLKTISNFVNHIAQTPIDEAFNGCGSTWCMSRYRGFESVYLNAPALEVLSKLPRVVGNPHVIPGKLAGTHLTVGGLEHPWRRIRAASQLDDVRIHDLRHSFASVAVAGGASLPMIGALLGHTKPETTQRYAHLAADPLRATSEAVAARIASAMDGRGQAPAASPVEELKSFRRRRSS